MARTYETRLREFEELLQPKAPEDPLYELFLEETDVQESF
jgi:hypothetical protein